MLEAQIRYKYSTIVFEGNVNFLTLQTVRKESCNVIFCNNGWELKLFPAMHWRKQKWYFCSIYLRVLLQNLSVACNLFCVVVCTLVRQVDSVFVGLLVKVGAFNFEFNLNVYNGIMQAPAEHVVLCRKPIEWFDIFNSTSALAPALL